METLRAESIQKVDTAIAYVLAEALTNAGHIDATRPLQALSLSNRACFLFAATGALVLIKRCL